MKSKALFMDRQSMLPDQTRVTMDQRELVTKENQNWWRSNYFFLWNKAVWISRFPQFEMWAWVKLEQHPNQQKCILLVQIFQSGLPNVNLYLLCITVGIIWGLCSQGIQVADGVEATRGLPIQVETGHIFGALTRDVAGSTWSCHLRNWVFWSTPIGVLAP